MLSKLNELDIDLLLFFNKHHNAFLDYLMELISGRTVWIPLYLFLVFLIIKEEKKSSWLTILIIIALAVCADRLSSGFAKPYFERLRPCHNLAIKDQLHMIVGCGGKYGYFSSHASNTFALAGFMTWKFSKKIKALRLLLVWAAFVSFSRVYLAKHYPFDIITGAVFGLALSWTFYKLNVFIEEKFKLKSAL